MEVRIGYDGIVFASAISGPAFTAFTEEQIYKALAKDLWVDGKLVPNPAKKWFDGRCNFATHIKTESGKAAKVNPLKASKRAAKGR